MNTHKLKYGSLYLILALLLLLSVLCAIRTGAVNITFREIFVCIAHCLGIHTQRAVPPIIEGLFLQIRLPRVLLCVIVGAGLSVSGALMQALFRNPIVEPGLIGTSSGAAFGAALIFVIGKSFFEQYNHYLGIFVLPLSAFVFSLVATFLVYRFSSTHGKVAVSTMILVGVAINAVAASCTGFLSYIARDPQARSITFWNLGTFSGANWDAVILLYSITIPAIFLVLRYSKQLNALLLGEEQAGYLGIDTGKLKSRIIVLNTLIVAIGTSLVGVIGFVGLIVPHILRMLKGSDNRYLIIGSALLGAIIMNLADMTSRLIIAPAELPIGIVTSFVGAPVFIWILRRQKGVDKKGGFYA